MAQASGSHNKGADQGVSNSKRVRLRRNPILEGGKKEGSSGKTGNKILCEKEITRLLSIKQLVGLASDYYLQNEVYTMRGRGGDDCMSALTRNPEALLFSFELNFLSLARKGKSSKIFIQVPL